MTFFIELPPDVEARFVAEANAKGVPVERHIMERLVESARTAEPAGTTPARPLKLPLLKGKIIGSLSRRDIYNDR